MRVFLDLILVAACLLNVLCFYVDHFFVNLAMGILCGLLFVRNRSVE